MTHTKVQCFCFRSKIPFLGKFGTKNPNCQFKLKFDTLANLNMRTSTVMFSFSFFDWKYPFWTNFVQKIKIVNLSWNLIHRLIRYGEFNYVVDFPALGQKYPFWTNLVQNSFSALDWKHLFSAKLAPKNENCQFKLKFCK